MDPTAIATRVCAALIRQGVLAEDGALHYRLHAALVAELAAATKAEKA